MVIPLCLLVVAGSPRVLLGNVVLILLGSVVARFVIVHIPHVAHHPSASGVPG
jgi:hypothetical protein